MVYWFWIRTHRGRWREWLRIMCVDVYDKKVMTNDVNIISAVLNYKDESDG